MPSGNTPQEEASPSSSTGASLSNKRRVPKQPSLSKHVTGYSGLCLVFAPCSSENASCGQLLLPSSCPFLQEPPNADRVTVSSHPSSLLSVPSAVTCLLVDASGQSPTPTTSTASRSDATRGRWVPFSLEGGQVTCPSHLAAGGSWTPKSQVQEYHFP